MVKISVLQLSPRIWMNNSWPMCGLMCLLGVRPVGLFHHDRGNTAGASGEIHRSLGPGAAGHVVPRAYPNPVAAAGPQCDPTAVTDVPLPGGG